MTKLKAWWRRLDSAGTYRYTHEAHPMWFAVGPVIGARYGGFTIRVWKRGIWIAPLWWKD